MKKETDTDDFSFEAMMTMNVAKVKKKKKVKNIVDESDTKCLQFTAAAPPTLRPTTSKAADAEPEMTDREAAIMATSRKKGGNSMMMQKKIKYVSKVYTLYEMSQKMLVNHPQYLLSCMNDFVYPADILMPALDRLDEKMLHLVSDVIYFF